MNRWVEKSALITGASSGIGRAIAKNLAIAGMNVFGVARRENLLEELSKDLQNIKGSFHYARCDVRNEEDILKTFKKVEEQFGGVDVLVNNAGIVKRDEIGDDRTENYRSVLEVNVVAPAICTREALISMRKRKTEGHIININSVLGIRTPYLFSNNNLYSPSKFALRAMTDILMTEIIRNKDNIRVTSIHPGLVKTDILRNSGFRQDLFECRLYLESEQVADCIVFALSAPAGVQVGQIVISPLHETF